MAKVIIIAGGTGTGKTRSIKGLDPETTAVINVLNKPLSFREAKEYKNVFHKDKWDAIVKLIRGVPDKITNLILDDIGYVMTGELFERASETGFNKFTEIGKHMQQILYEAINMRPDLNIFFMFHTDDEYSDKVKVGKKLKTIGQLLEDKYDPLGVVTISLFTEVSWDKEGSPVYSFITNRVNINGIVIPAKSPEGMFESIRIPNDLSLVVNAISEYYK